MTSHARAAAHSRGRAARLRGRSGEAGVLTDLVAAVRAGQSRVLVVRGEPHVARSRHHRDRAHRVPERVHLRWRRIARRRAGGDGEDRRTGYENGYQVITLTDCTAATSVAEHENAISYDYPMFSKPMTADEVIAEFR